jgi:hypothetical protein
MDWIIKKAKTVIGSVIRVVLIASICAFWFFSTGCASLPLSSGSGANTVYVVTNNTKPAPDQPRITHRLKIINQTPFWAQINLAGLPLAVISPNEETIFVVPHLGSYFGTVTYYVDVSWETEKDHTGRVVSKELIYGEPVVQKNLKVYLSGKIRNYQQEPFGQVLVLKNAYRKPDKNYQGKENKNWFRIKFQNRSIGGI